jgi:hypothetical protein
MDIIELKYIGKLTEFSSLSEFEASLQRFLNSGCSFWTDGRLIFTKQLVDRINNLKIEIYSNEHGIPHFHVNSNEINAVFSIKDCSLIKGSINRNELKLIQYWFDICKPKLIEIWNKTRPGDCKVGHIIE